MNLGSDIMIIGIDASRANNEQKTGVEWYAYFLIQELKKSRVQSPESRGKDVQFVLYSDKPLKGDLATLPENWTSKVLRWPPKRFWTQIRMSFEMLVHPPDVLFIPAHVFPLIHPKKTVMTIHDVAATRFPESYNWFERWYSVWSAKRALKILWRIIAPSEFTKKELIKIIPPEADQSLAEKHKNIKTDKVSIVHHGYSKIYKKIENETQIGDVLEKYGIRKPFIMTIGRLEEKKNTKRMIEVFTQLRNKNPKFELQLVLVGKPGYGYEKVEQLIETSSYKDDIVRPGWVNEKDIPYLMNAAEIFLFPSLYEGFGLPILEAMACGTPVIVSKGNSLEEVGGDAVVYIDAHDIDSIASGIEKVLYDENLKREKIEKGFERAKQFSWERSADETLKILLR